jgi:hypothetical protein
MNAPLYSLVVEYAGKSYTTQVNAASAEAAVVQYFDAVYTASFAAAFGESAPLIGVGDIVYLAPMDGLINVWAACVGQNGSYISLVCTRTAPRQEGAIDPPEFEDEATLFSLSGEYLEAASILHNTLITQVNVSLVTFYLLGHASELLLKSFLFKKGDTIENLKFRLGHNLAKLIKQAKAKGLPDSLPLRYVLALSVQYSSKQTEYRKTFEASLPPLDLLLQEVRGLQAHVFNHVAEFENGENGA